ncbi:MAG: hypothetical protein EOP61_17235 [Sphingomonadales bacterium]|nr:MAG: hypothetical protein EOP61_17235 [Sphingomonadales bacterium]
MATAFNLVDYRTIEPVRRPRLRIVEPAVAPIVRKAAVTENAPVIQTAPVEDRKPMPPSWMVAPPFATEELVVVREPQTACRTAPTPSAGTPYRSVREVPRAAW